jgi:hypothetical protein
MTERETMLACLTEDHGIEADEAEKMLVDADLWLVHPSQRFGIEAGKEVEVWSEAVEKLEAMEFVALNANLYGNVAVAQCLADARARVEVKLERARGRAGRG